MRRCYRSVTEGSFAGQTVRLRIAEDDNQGFFQAGVDAVRLVDASASVDPASP